MQDWVARSRIEIEQARLLVLKAAWMMDEVGNKEARQEIGMIKVAAPTMALGVIDRAMQAFGAAGVSQDAPWRGRSRTPARCGSSTAPTRSS